MPTLTFKVTDAEARAIRVKARAAKAKSVSSFLRSAVLGADSGAIPVARRLHPVSGLPYNATPGRKVTAEEISDALADFP
jgi:hypothetical protein